MAKAKEHLLEQLHHLRLNDIAAIYPQAVQKAQKKSKIIPPPGKKNRRHLARPRNLRLHASFRTASF